MGYVMSPDETYKAAHLRLAGAPAALLWTVALFECAAIDGNGVLSELMVKDAGNLYDLRGLKLAPRLVETGAWHDPDTLTACTACLEQPSERITSGWLIHGWWVFLQDNAGKNDPVYRWREQRRKALNRMTELKLRIRQRDGDLCQYCGILTVWGADHKSPKAGTYDHVDPFCTDGPKGYGNTYGNLVVACKRCNGVKKDRTPEQAGMTMIRIRAGLSSPDPDRSIGNPAQDPARPRVTREAGPGRIGVGSRPDIESGRHPVPAVVSNGNGTHTEEGA